MFDRIRTILRNAIEQKIFPGCALGLIDSGRITFICEGNIRYETDSDLVTPHTIYDVASVTKAIPTSSLAHWFLQQKKLKLTDLLIDYLPTYAGNYREEITIRHLLTHTLDFTFRLSALADKTPDEILATIFNAQLQARPGTVYHYANATSILLGLVIEKVAGEPLERLAQKVFFTPLEMNHTFLGRVDCAKYSVAPTECMVDGSTVCGVVHDESARALLSQYRVGAAGLFSTADNLSRFMSMVLNAGVCNGNQFFTEQTISSFYTNQLGMQLNHQTALGWELNQNSYMGTRHSDHTFGKTGFTGSVIVADYDQKRAFVFLTNHTWPHRFTDRSAINRVRSGIADAFFSSL